jgi:hypothetical protein
MTPGILLEARLSKEEEVYPHLVFEIPSKKIKT